MSGAILPVVSNFFAWRMQTEMTHYFVELETRTPHGLHVQIPDSAPLALWIKASDDIIA